MRNLVRYAPGAFPPASLSRWNGRDGWTPVRFAERRRDKRAARRLVTELSSSASGKATLASLGRDSESGREAIRPFLDSSMAAIIPCRME